METQATPSIVFAEYEWEVVPICAACWKEQHPGHKLNKDLEPSYIPRYLKNPEIRPCYNCTVKRPPVTYVYRSFKVR